MTAYTLPQCDVFMDREPGVAASLESIHECGGNDWTCPNGVYLELAHGEYEDSLDGLDEQDEAVKALWDAYSLTFEDAWEATVSALVTLGWAPGNARDAVRRVRPW